MQQQKVCKKTKPTEMANPPAMLTLHRWSLNNSTFFVVVLVSLLLFQILGNPKHGLLGQTFLKPGLETVLTGFKNLTRNSKSCLKPEFETLPLAENPVLNSNPDSAQPFELQMCLMKCPVEKQIYSNPSAFLKVKASHALACMHVRAVFEESREQKIGFPPPGGR